MMDDVTAERSNDAREIIATMHTLLSFSMLASAEAEPQNYHTHSLDKYYHRHKNPYRDVLIITNGAHVKPHNLSWLLTRTLRAQNLNETQVLATSSANVIYLWDLVTGNCLRDYTANSYILSMHALSNGNVVCLTEDAVQVIDIRNEIILNQMITDDISRKHMFVTDQGTIILPSERNDKIIIWTLHSAVYTSKIVNIENAYTFRCMVQMSDEIVVFGGKRRCLFIVDTEDFRVLKIAWCKDYTTSMLCLDDGTLATGHSRGNVLLLIAY
jgi:WD40 repeat protein